MSANRRNGSKPELGSGKVVGLLLGAAAGAAYLMVVRPWHLHWGTTEAEGSEPLPGDDRTPQATETSTHAITIHAPASAIWPWLVQIGQDRGGFYSYAWLENLVECRLHNADQILPEFQQIAVGDRVRLHPKAPPLPVVLVVPERALILGSNTEEPGTWGFYLKEIEPDTSRLVIRSRTQRKPGLFRWLGHYALFEPAHFVMERKMLLTVKERVESTLAKSSVSPIIL